MQEEHDGPEDISGRVSAEDAEKLRQEAMGAALPPPEEVAPPDAKKEVQIPEKLALTGGDFFVKLRLPSALRAKHTKAAVLALQGAGTVAAAKFAWAEALLPVVIDDWNLVDDGGQPLPVPTPGDPSSLDELTTEHFMELNITAWMYVEILTPPTAFKEFSRQWDSPTSASGG